MALHDANERVAAVGVSVAHQNRDSLRGTAAMMSMASTRGGRRRRAGDERTRRTASNGGERLK